MKSRKESVIYNIHIPFTTLKIEVIIENLFNITVISITLGKNVYQEEPLSAVLELGRSKGEFQRPTSDFQQNCLA